jgi:hypothetical protein
MEVVKSANLALRFILELCAVVSVGVWGFQLDRGTTVRWIAGVGGSADRDRRVVDIHRAGSG